ncbi:alpha-L-arabinofuranosidase [Maribellus comscasis]|uniref:Alpha-L-arabinofuranosidase n=1 Tax=Maribellus comscasis TaxID=2681766 RepID=A0A6I6KBF9_9BACT|nr:alpha-L-arabinofuranosidase C-terminal domain-containing protein [Maribellus comscasis]QGY47564.1 alpha-L-arabinofuranosidase [Maribellus comscasis]
MKRRNFIKITGVGSASVIATSKINMAIAKDAFETSEIKINPSPKFELSPWLYMQFMEPLGVTDGSVEAAWDHGHDKWREDVVNVTRELAPGMIRWGGILSSYYRWREAVGLRDSRKPMYNIQWEGMETNQIGTSEFVDFCNQVNADPLMTVNFESEGNPNWATTPKGDVRSADAAEAAEWVDYCNNPSNRERIKHGFKEPFNIKTWQIGNETSYGRNRFDLKTAAKKTVEFAKAMKKVDPSIQLIGWGDSGWSKKMIEEAGEYIDFIAFHHMYNPGRNVENSPLRDNKYREDPAATWEILMDGYKPHEEKIKNIRDEVIGTGKPLALTECHYALPGRNRCEVLSSWATGVSYARLMNLHERNGDLLKIATLADFCGTRWQVNAIMIPVPGGKSFMMPVAKIMSLYRHHTGKNYLEVENVPGDLDITASRTGNTVFLHVVNTSRYRTIKTSIDILNMQINSGKAFELKTDPEFEIMRAENDPLLPIERNLNVEELVEFPPASVTAVELNVV